MLSKTAEHALRAMIYLARQDQDRSLSVKEISQGVGGPQNYLGKTLGSLARHGIVSSSPGRNGGFRLAIPPDELTIARVVNAVDPPNQTQMCLMGGRPCTEEDPCQAHLRWKAILDLFRGHIEDVTVADLLSG
jgi:Rrf2 family protein